MSTQDSRPATAAAFTRFSLKPIARSVQLALLAGVAAPALAAPTGGQVRAGSADISTPARGMTVINQRSQRAAIDWRSFDVARNETVRFNQPNAKASALNRIFDQKPSEIFGQIKSNGEVILLNPNGVFFKPGAEVHVGSLIAAAMNVGIDDFMSGRYRLEAQPGSDGRVVNQGRIQAEPGGDVALLGRTVANEGVIVATAGRVSLLAGEKATVDFDGDGLLRFSVDEAVVENAQKLDDQVANTGEIRADGGQILITARAAEGVFKHAINNGGLIQAARIDKQGGKVRLTGLGPGASVLNTGTVDASAGDIDSRGGRVVVAADTIEQRGTLRADATGDRGGSVKLVGKSRVTLDAGSEISVTSAAAKGGTVKATGEQLELNFDAEVDASGARGGGQVLLGGGARGEDTSLPNANTTFVSGAARIAADATAKGDGGEVVVWADGSTWFYGDISAKGGPAGGDGGFVEVSGKRNLLYRGAADATAPRGEKGTLLLDPDTLSIIDADNGGEEDPELPDVLEADDVDDGNPNTNTVSWGQIEAQGANAVIVLEATNDVTVENINGGAGISSGNVVGLSLTTGGSLTLRSIAGDVVFADANDTIRTEGGAIFIDAAAGAVDLGNLNTSGAAGDKSGTIQINTADGGDFGGINTGGALATFDVATGPLDQRAATAITGTAALTKTGAGILVLNSTTNTYSGTTTISGGTLELGADNVLSNNSAVSVGAAGTLDFNDNDDTVAALSGAGGATLDLGRGNLTASGNINLTGMNIVMSGANADTEIRSTAGSLTLDALTKSNTGNLTLGAATGIDINGTLNVQGGDLILDGGFTAQNNLLAAGNITFQGASTGTFDGAGDQTVSATGAGHNITDTAGAVLTKTNAGNLILQATGGNLGVDASNRLGVAVTGGGAVRVNTNNVFLQSASNLTVDALTTAAGANTVNIATTGTATLSLTGANANLAGDGITLSSAGDLTIGTSNNLAGTTVALTAGTGVASATIDLNAIVSGSTSLSLTGAAATSTLDAAGLSGALTFTASGDGTGNVTGGLTATYSGIDSLVGGTGIDTLVGFRAYTITGANSGTASTPGSMTWSGIENLTGTANTDTFTQSGGSLSGTIDGLGQTDKVAGYSTYAVNVGGGTATTGGVTASLQGIETLEGTAGADTFTLSGGTIGTIDALGGDDTVTLSANTTATTVLLGAGADTLDLATFTLSGGVDGGSESDTLAGATSYTVTGSGSGTSGNITGTAPTWSSFENLTGTSNVDSFTFNTGAALTGTVSGLGGNDVFTLNANVSVALLSGGDNNDTFNLGDGTTLRTLTGSIDGGNGTDTVVGASSYTLTGAGSGTSSGLVTGTYSNIENLTGTVNNDTFTVSGGSLTGTVNGAGGTDTLSGDTSYTVSGTASGTSGAVAAWQSIESLTGSAAADTFTFQATAVMTGTIDGGGNADLFTVTAGATVASIVGGAGSDTLAGSTSYTVSGNGSGSATGVTAWSGLENLTGTAGNDSFSFNNSAAALTGTVDGLAGNDTFTLTQNAAVGLLQGGADNDTFNLGTGASRTLTGNIDGGTGTDSLANSNSYSLTGVGSGNAAHISGGTYTGIENLAGTTSDDTFAVAGGSVTGTVNGLGGNDLLSGASVYLVNGDSTGTSNATGVWSNIESLTGSSGDDTFTFENTATLSGLVSGGDGNDLFVINGTTDADLQGQVGNDVFELHNDGTVLTGTLDGDAFFDTTPSGDSNSFLFFDRARLVGFINGGVDSAGENDVVDLRASDIANSVTLDAGGNGDLSRLSGEPDFIITGTSNGNNGIRESSFLQPGAVFTSAFTFWYIGGENTGVVANSLAALALFLTDPGNAGNLGNFVTFTNVTAIAGGIGSDVFFFDSDGHMTSPVTGGGGAGVDSVAGSTGIDQFTITGTDSIDINVGGLITQFTSINNINAAAGDGGGAALADTGNDSVDLNSNTWTGDINGGAGTNTLLGATGYIVTGSNAGTATQVGGTWSQFQNLTGTSGSDTFTFNTGSVLSGTANGLDGVNGFTANGTASVGAIVGGAGVDTVTLSGTANVGSVGTAGGADVINLNGVVTVTSISAGAGADVVTLSSNASVTTLAGDGESDTFNLAGFTLTGSIDGGSAGANSDTLTGADNYTVSGTDAGTSTQVTGGFSDIENLTGTASGNSFVFSAGSALNGTATGGAGADSFLLAGNASVTSVQGGGGADVLDLGGFTLTGSFNGGVGGVDQDVVTGATAYTVNGTDAGATPQISGGFSEVENLTGTAGSDSFNFDAGSALTGDADGSGGDDSFVLAGNASVASLRGSSGDDSFDLGGFLLTGQILGGLNNDTIAGANQYTVNAANGGASTRISGGFVGVENLTGTAGVDNFSFAAGGALDGDARGLAGDDIFTLTGDAAAANLMGDSDSDTFNLDGFVFTGVIDGRGTGSNQDVLAGASDYTVTGVNAGTSNFIVGSFTGIENLTGTTGADSFVFNAGASLSGTASGLGGADSFTLTGDASAATLSGGSESDSFDLNGFVLTGTIDGGTSAADDDTLAGSDNYTLTAANGGETSLITGGFSTIESLTGTAGDDTFTLNGGSVTGTLDGGLGDDVLSGSASYTVTSADTGSATGVALWQNIENLTGTTGNDTFTFNAGASLTGNARGLAGDDTFTLAGNAAAANLIGDADDDTFNLAGFVFTGAIDGRGTGTNQDVLTGASDYTVTGIDAGTSSQINGTFVDIENLTGTSGADTFNFDAGSQLTGTANGTGGADSFVLLGDAAAGSLQGAAGDDVFALDGFTLTGAVDGGADSDFLTGADNYTVTGANAGQSTRVTGNFTNIENLTGTANADSFVFHAGSSLSGNAAGLAEADTFVLSGNASVALLAGGGGDDTFNLAGFSLTGSVDGGNGGSDVLRGSDTFVLTGADSGTSPDVSASFSDIENLTGTAGNDTFTVNGGTLSGAINGLRGATDRIVGDNSYTINGANSGSSGAIAAFVNIETLTGTTGADNFNFQGGSLAGAAEGIGGADTFNISASGGVSTMQLNGGDADDVFNLSNDAVLTGNINGGNGNDTVNFGTPNANPPTGNTDRSRVDGSVNLGAGAGDRLDISGSDLFTAVAVDAVVSAEGRSGSITGTNGDPDLLSNGFTGVDDLRGNGKGAIVGANAATFWRVTGTNRGEFSTNSSALGAPGSAAGVNGASTFINFAIRGGSAADTYIFDSAGFIQIGITDIGGANVLVGSAGADTFTLTGARTVGFSVNGSGNTTTVTALAGSLDIDGSVTTLRFPGDTGNDSFVFSGNTNWRGAINGGGGVDTLDLSGRSQAATATVSGISTQGLVVTTANFAGEFRNIEVLNTGAGDDLITLAVDPTGNTTSIDTGAGIDEIRSLGDATWVVNGDGAGVIRAGNAPSAANQVQFSGLENLSTNGDATLTLPSTAGAAASLAGAFSADRIALTPGAVFTGSLGLRLDAPVTSNGSLTLNLGNGNLEMRDSLNVNGNFRMVGPFGDFQAVTTTGSQTYVGEAQLNGNLNAGGDLSFSTFLTIVGNVALNSATNVFDFNGEVQGNTDAVLSIVPTANTDMFIDLEDGPGHIAADRFDTFRGTLVIGGLFEATPDRNLLAGKLLSAPADYITVGSSLITGGDLMLVGSTVDFSQGTGLEVGSTDSQNGDVAILALGDAIQSGNNGLTGGVPLGNITGTGGSTTMRFLGNRVMLAARGEIENSTNMIMALNGGDVLVAQSAQAVQQQVNFNVQSNATPSAQNVTDTALVVSLGSIPGATITSPTGLFQNARVFFPNPAAIITILQAVAFVDSSLFEEDLSLFGVIGDGIAKSLDQCEDAEGCAPSVTAEQLVELIGGLDARIATLEKELAAGDIDRAKGETLLARYRAERKNYTDYQAQLEAYNARQAEEQSGGDEFEDVFEAEETPDAAPAATPESGEAPAAEDAPSLEENSEDLFAPLEDSPVPEAAPAAPAATPDVDEGFEMLEDEAPAAAPSAPAAPSSPAPAAPAGGDDGGGDDFEELEELPDASLLNDKFTPGAVNQLAGMLRLDAQGAVTWEGDVLLPTLHRRY
ncbi:MAG: filamentous hemagglutinin N-terminal domain-containing protein [Gammaproteobacteria bacterium]|nr:filamentous hemagglutinin N-terminal domain-containing protein [Gammaproteobacteria bacterium]